ncbi:MAG: hypothetical protein ACYDCK_04510 [Thermoplasmatota archaeon]
MRALARVFLAFLLVAPSLAAVALAPAARAQTPTNCVPSCQPTLVVFVDDPGTLLAFNRVNTLTAHVRYSFPPGSFTQQDIVVSLGLKLAPSWMKVTFGTPIVTFTPDTLGTQVPPPTPPIPPTGPPTPPSPFVNGGAYERAVPVNVTLFPGAPADTKGNFSINASAKPSGNLAGAATVSPEISLKAAWLPSLNVTAPAGPLHVSGGRAYPLTFHVLNDGNAVVLVTLTVSGKPQYAQVNSLANLTAFKPGQSADVTVWLRTPWTQTQRGLVELEATPIHVKDLGQPDRASVDVEGASVVPATPLFAPVALLGVVALVARRARST